jgi:hypothetical protein
MADLRPSHPSEDNAKLPVHRQEEQKAKKDNVGGNELSGDDHGQWR